MESSANGCKRAVGFDICWMKLGEPGVEEGLILVQRFDVVIGCIVKDVQGAYV